MATEEKAAKQGFSAKFMHWYESYQGKKVVNIVYSAGASVVIVGALFKILHWPLASQVLMVGMFTEAFLFLIGTLEHPHPEFHWENVFPQLLEFGANPELLEAKAAQPRPTLLGAGSEAGAPVASTPEAKAKVPALKDEDLQALKDGISDLAKTASQLSELNKVAQTGGKLSEKLAAAEAATANYSLTIPGDKPFEPTSFEVFQAEQSILQGIAENESCVIAGRLGFYVFRDHPNHLSILIQASTPFRLDRVMRKKNIPESEAKKTIEQVDKMRENYVNEYTKTSRYDTRNYDLVITADGKTEDEIVDIIMAFIS